MVRLAFFLTMVLTTFLACAFSIDVTDETGVSVSAALQFDQRIGEMSVRYYHFKGGFQTTIDGLRHGTITLREGRSHVIALAREYHPVYLTHLASAEKGATDEERVARNLVAHIHFIEEINPNPESRLPELKAELDQLVCALR